MSTTTETLLEQLARQVFALGAEVASLREELATEVRTRRLVVEHESGFESIVAAVADDAAQISVVARTDPDTFVRLHVSERDARGVGDVFGGLYLSGGGNGVGMFEVHQHGDPNSTTYSAILHVVEDRGRVRLDADGLAFKDW